jgi:peptide/nickel transport system ATP-binding protein
MSPVLAIRDMVVSFDGYRALDSVGLDVEDGALLRHSRGVGLG